MTDFFIRPSDPDDTADVGGVLFVDVNNVGSGTGNYDTFLKVGGNDEQIFGYNTDDGGSLHPDNPYIGASQTETLLLANITSVFIGDEEYYQIRFDLNEPNTDSVSEQISIEEFRIWIGDTSSVITRAELEALTKIYDLDAVDTTGDGAADDNTILMSEVSTGSGTDDYAIFIPVSLFGDADPTDTYVYFDVTLGQNAPSDYEQAGGFEEFNIIEAGYIFGTKFEDLNGNGVQDGGELRLEGIRIYIDANNDGMWNEGEKFDITNEDGEWFLTGVQADGANLIIREELPDVAPGEYDWEATNPDGVDGNGAYWNASVNSTGDNTEIHIGNFQPRPSFTVEKAVASVDPTGNLSLDAVGDIVTYSITVHNDGNVPLTDVTVTDPLLGGAVTSFTGDDGDGVLSPGETWVYTGSYALTQDDLDSDATEEPANTVAGLLENTACVVASYDGVALEEQCDDADVPVYQDGGIALVKEADVTFIEAPGQITYTYTLTNTGNYAQTIASLIDDNYTPGDTGDDLDILALGSFSGDTDGDGKLDVGETWVYEITVDIDEATYLANDLLINNACALTTDDEEACDDETVEVHRYDIAIEKVAVDVIGSETLEVTAAGQEIVYEISVENTGNRTLTNLTVEDSLDPSLVFTGGDTNGNGAFDAGETWTYEARYLVTQADMDGNGIDIDGEIDGDGDVDNRATADADKVNPVTDDEEVPLIQIGGIVLEKTSTTTVISGPQTVTYTFTLTADNIANYAQTIGTIVDFGFIDGTGDAVLDASDDVVLYVAGGGEYANGDTNMDGKLDLGETWTLSYVVDITEEMFNSNLGGLTNVACATTTDGEEACDDHDIDRRIIDIEKTVFSVDGSTVDKVVDEAGEEIVYRITVSNPGDVGLENVVVTDTIADAVYESGDTNDDGILDTDEDWIYRATYTATQADLDDNFDGDKDIDNVATAVATGVGPVDDDAEVPIRYVNGVELEKTSDVEVITRPEEGVPTMVTYTVTLRPAGGANYEQFINMVVDEGFGEGTMNDIDQIFYNASYVEGVSDPDLAPLYAFGQAPGDTDNDGYLDVNEVWSFSFDAEITREMFDANLGQLNNVACVDVNDLGEICTEYNIDRRDIAIDKTVFSINGDETDDVVNWAGDVISYRIAVSNPGDLGLTGVVVTDSIADVGSVVYLSGDTDGDDVLDTDETWIYGATYTVTQADIDGNGIDINGLIDGDGDIDNRATAIADLVGEVWDEAEVDILQEPGLSLIKEVVDVGGDGADGVADEAGDVITYRLVATNTGNVTLTNVTITDPLTGTDSTVFFPSLTLNPGDSVTLANEQYTVTQADLDSQGVTADGGDPDCDIDNTGVADSDQTPAVEASAVVPLDYNPSVDLEKLVSVNGNPFVDADLPTGPQVTVNGSMATFRIELTNTGNISLTNVTLADVLDPDGAASSIDLTPYTITGLTDTDGDNVADDLAVGDTAWLEYSMAVTADQHTNRATVTFFDNEGNQITDKAGEAVTDSDDANYFGLIGDGPGVRTPGGWGNSWKLKSYWDGIEGFVAGDETFPDQEIDVNMMVNGELRQGIIIGGDYDNVLEDGEIFVDLATACDLLENSTGGNKRDKLDDLARHAIAATLNGLAGNNIYDEVADDDLDSPEDWLQEAADWLLASSSRDGELLVSGYDRGATLIRANSDAWQDGYAEGDIASGSDILGALGEYNETGVIDGVRYAHDADSAVLATALSIAADEFLFG